MKLKFWKKSKVNQEEMIDLQKFLRENDIKCMKCKIKEATVYFLGNVYCNDCCDELIKKLSKALANNTVYRRLKA